MTEKDYKIIIDEQLMSNVICLIIDRYLLDIWIGDRINQKSLLKDSFNNL